MKDSLMAFASKITASPQPPPTDVTEDFVI